MTDNMVAVDGKKLVYIEFLSFQFNIFRMIDTPPFILRDPLRATGRLLLGWSTETLCPVRLMESL